MSMLLAVNVGNTNLSFGIFHGTRLVHHFQLPARRDGSVRFWTRELARMLKTRRPAKPESWDMVVAASVVPEIQAPLTQALATVFGTKVYWVTPRTPMTIKNTYCPPHSLGVDRLVNAVAAVEEFGAPVLVVDAGTAITVDAIDRNNCFLGGAILPGLQMAMEALAEKTSLVPKVALSAPASLLGRSTTDGLRSGIVGGTGGAAAFLIQGIRKKIGPKAPVIGTGGAIRAIYPCCRAITHLRPHLTLEGLRLIGMQRTTVTRRRQSS
jgi:type III pantothenate kinase